MPIEMLAARKVQLRPLHPAAAANVFISSRLRTELNGVLAQSRCARDKGRQIKRLWRDRRSALPTQIGYVSIAHGEFACKTKKLRAATARRVRRAGTAAVTASIKAPPI